MSTSLRFTFRNLRDIFSEVITNGYQVLRCMDYVNMKHALPERVLVNRIDIDFSVKKAERLALIFNELEIRGTFFVRLHAPEYNPFSFENYRILKFIRNSGHEIGYHSEIIEQAAIWNESAEECLIRDINTLDCILGITTKGVASHGGLTGLNNLDFWKNRKPGEFGLLYEAYDDQPEFDLFKNSLYVSDSNWTHWKCYENGSLIEGDHRSPAEHSHSGHPAIYSLIHSDTYYDSHFYE